MNIRIIPVVHDELFECLTLDIKLLDKFVEHLNRM